MQIACPSCTTSYRVEPSSLGTTGRPVRCVRCRTIWFARNPGALAAVTRDFRAEAQSLTAADQSELPVSWSAADAMPEASPPAADANQDEQTIADQAWPQPDWPQQAWPEQASSEGTPAEQTLVDHAAAVQASADVVWADRAHAVPDSAEPVFDAAPAVDQPPVEPGLVAGEWPAGGAHPLSQASVVEGHALAADVETIAARRAPRAMTRARAYWPLPGLPTAILVLVALNAALIGGRAEVVRYLPQTASLYAAIGLPVNLRGLAFSQVATTTETHDGVPVLVVEGTIVSAKERAVEVPRLRFSVRNQNGQEVYAWTAMPGRSVLGPGETVAFKSRLASPPSETHDVLVRFFNRHDRVAGVH